ncbi:uncharacterized protein LOC127880311 [Dreissena polymorpha]|uniref:Methyltransferase FkbM domain-containing protein n=1 Tax=Dreissena polymorpha TaxID=45954 RepID=A0A9D4K0J1_DREPO|nr:uncharacterized protein LOC127880311 [Dreissena polymorpha]KAH3829924.1 hypothetical protein DPMN_103155 [Dreissena polymorpha]
MLFAFGVASMQSRIIKSSPNNINVHRLACGSDSCIHRMSSSLKNTTVEPVNLCVGLKVPGFKETPICIYDPKIDAHMSALLAASGLWEGHLVTVVHNILSREPDMEFMDIGCNVGPYTITVAQRGRKVVAIDANKRNLELLMTSLQMGNLTQNVTLLWNALSDKVETMTLRLDLAKAAKNIGGTHVESGGNFSEIGTTVQSVMLDDLIGHFGKHSLFIKIDIEASEWKALMGGKQFFESVHIKYILMEWGHYKNDKLSSGDYIINFLSDRSFRAYDPQNMNRELKIKDRYSWPFDILWMKTA